MFAPERRGCSSTRIERRPAVVFWRRLETNEASSPYCVIPSKACCERGIHPPYPLHLTLYTTTSPTHSPQISSLSSPFQASAAILLPPLETLVVIDYFSRHSSPSLCLFASPSELLHNLTEPTQSTHSPNCPAKCLSPSQPLHPPREHIRRSFTNRKTIDLVAYCNRNLRGHDSSPSGALPPPLDNPRLAVPRNLAG
jgi:hypothetical protein